VQYLDIFAPGHNLLSAWSPYTCFSIRQHRLKLPRRPALSRVPMRPPSTMQQARVMGKNAALMQPCSGEGKNAAQNSVMQPAKEKNAAPSARGRKKHHAMQPAKEKNAMQSARDDNSGMNMWMIFYLWVAPVPDSNRDGYFFPPTGNPTDTRYFTTAIILGCKQVKMCSFCYINYELF
jgi:hypothetical protein